MAGREAPSPDAPRTPRSAADPGRGLTHRRHDRGLELIAAFKFLKALLLTLAGAGALSLLRPENAAEVREWLAALTIGRGQMLVERALTFLNVASPTRIRELGIASVAYGLLFAT